MDTINPTDTLLPICAALILVSVLAVRAAGLRKRPWNAGDMIALLFSAAICLGIAFPQAVLVAV